MAALATDGKGNWLTLNASGDWVPTAPPEEKPPAKTGGDTTSAAAQFADVPGGGSRPEVQPQAGSGGWGAWVDTSIQPAPNVGTLLPFSVNPGTGHAQIAVPNAVRAIMTEGPQGYLPGPPGQPQPRFETPAATIDPNTGALGVTPEAQTGAGLFGPSPLMFAAANRLFVPPGTFDRGAPLSPEFLQNPLGTSFADRPMPEPSGPTSATGVPPKEPPIEMHAVSADTGSASPVPGAAPKTAAEAKAVAGEFYKINAAQGGREMPPDFINALIDDLNERGPKGPLETAVAGENRVGRIAAQVKELRDQPTTLEDAQRTYSRIGDEATAEFKQNGNSETYRDLVQIQANMRDRIAPPDMSGNDAWTNARKAWSQAMKMDDLERIQQRAEMTDNVATSIKSGLRVLLSNPNRIRGYSPEEIQALRDASERGALGSILHVFGSRLIPIVAASAEAGTGGLTSGLVAAGTAHGVTSGIRAAAEALQTRRLNQALSTLAEKVPRNQMMPPP